MARNKAMNNLVKNATKFKRPTVPMGVMNTGVANIPRKNTRSLADGGIATPKRGLVDEPGSYSKKLSKEPAAYSYLFLM